MKIVASCGSERRNSWLVYLLTPQHALALKTREQKADSFRNTVDVLLFIAHCCASRKHKISKRAKICELKKKFSSPAARLPSNIRQLCWQHFHNSFLCFSRRFWAWSAIDECAVKRKTKKNGNDVNRHLLRLCWGFILNFKRDPNRGLCSLFMFMTHSGTSDDEACLRWSARFDSASYLLHGFSV